MKLISKICGLSVIVAGCAVQPSDRAVQIQEALPEQVEGCDFLRTVSGSSGQGGLAAREIGLSNAKAAALEAAAASGATHIVWTSLDNGFMSSQAHGRAYRCP